MGAVGFFRANIYFEKNSGADSLIFISAVNGEMELRSGDLVEVRNGDLISVADGRLYTIIFNPVP
jgi:hypothetical protein